MVLSFSILGSLGVSAVILLLVGSQAIGHCNTRQGPVAIDVRKALENDNFLLIARWISEEDEEELKEKFDKCTKIYQEENGEKQEIAKEYLMETTVRLHRAAEEMPFEGLKSIDSFPEDIEKGEEALEEENIDPILNLLENKLKNGTEKWFQEAVEAKQNKDENIEKSRNYGRAYVKYLTFVHKIYNEIKSGPPHGLR